MDDSSLYSLSVKNTLPLLNALLDFVVTQKIDCKLLKKKYDNKLIITQHSSFILKNV